MIRALTAKTEDASERLDRFLSSALDISRNAAVRLIEQGYATVSGKVLSKNYRLTGSEEIVVQLPEAEETELIMLVA